MKVATVLGMFFAAISSFEAEPDLRQSIGARLLAAVTEGDALKNTRAADGRNAAMSGTSRLIR